MAGLGGGYYSSRTTGQKVGLSPGGYQPPNTSSAMGQYGQPFGAGNTTPGRKPPSPYGAPVPHNVPGGGTGGGGGYGGSAPGSTDIYNSNDANYIRNLPTAYTPEQQLLMRNRARETNTGQNLGSDLKIRELMAQQGMGGSGAEAAAMMGNQARNAAGMQSALSNIDISNAQTDMANRYAKGGLLNTLMGTGMDQNKLGEMGRQFDVGQYNDLYKWGNETDYQRALDRTSNNSYNDQLAQLLKLLGI